MNSGDGVAPRGCRPPGTAVNPAVIVGPGGPAIDAGDTSLRSGIRSETDIQVMTWFLEVIDFWVHTGAPLI